VTVCRSKTENYLVIGGTSGIGAEVVRTLVARENTQVIFCGRNAVAGVALCAELDEVAAGRAEFVQADVTSTDSLDELFAHVRSSFNRLDGAFNGAGISGQDSVIRNVTFHESSETQFDQLFETNVKGMWRSLRHELTIMARQTHGAIVNCSSVAGLRCADSRSASYTASKHAVVGLSRALAVEYAPLGVRVNAVCPGVIDTPMLGEMRHELLADLRKKNAGARLGSPREVADAVAFLLSDQSTYISGTTLTVDAGGLHGAL